MPPRPQEEHSQETPEALLQPGREQLAQMQLLADRLVLIYGEPTDDSRTAMWQRGNRTYFLGRGGSWEDLTGEPATNENWLHVIEATPEDAPEGFYVPASATHCISPDNDLLAGNRELREEVAAVLRAQATTELLAFATEIAHATEMDGKAWYHNGVPYTFTTFPDATMPFAFLQVGEYQYELDPDCGIIPRDASLPIPKGSGMDTSVEGRLIHMFTVVADGSTSRGPGPEQHQPETDDNLEQLGTPGRIIVEHSMQLVRSWAQENAGMEIGEPKKGVIVARAVIPEVMFDGADGAVGILVTRTSIVVEIVSLDGLVHERTEADLEASKAASLRNRDDTVCVGLDAAYRIGDVLDECVSARFQEVAKPCPLELTVRFDKELLRTPKLAIIRNQHNAKT